MKIRKAIIPAAGLGTRFLPATKAQPKEMLPVVDKPTIQYIVEEAVKSGIEDIIIISGRGKRAIEDHFDKSYELEETLVKKEKYDLLKEVQEISELANIHYIRQKEPKGLGHAVSCARRFIGDEPFAVLLGDDIMHSQDNEIPALKELINVYDEHKLPVIGYKEVQQNDVDKYGIIKPKSESDLGDLFEIEGLVEKPNINDAPSNYAIMGRYVLTPGIFEILNKQKPGSGGEIQLTDAINELNYHQQVLAYQLKGNRYDVGDKLGFIKATIEIALQREDLRDDLSNYLSHIVKGFNQEKKVTK